MNNLNRQIDLSGSGSGSTPAITSYFINLNDSDLVSPLIYQFSIGAGLFKGTTASGAITPYGVDTTIPCTPNTCYDVLNNYLFDVVITSLGGGNFTYALAQRDALTGVAIQSWSSTGFTAGILPTADNMFVDISNSQLYFIGAGLGATYNGAAITSGVLYVSTLGVGTITGATAVPSGALSPTARSTVVNPGTGKIFDINLTTPTVATFSPSAISAFSTLTGYTNPVTNLTKYYNIIDGFLYLLAPNSCQGVSSGTSTTQYYVLVNKINDSGAVFFT